MLESKEGKSAFERALMEASIFLPPLYIGKADNLYNRYYQHINSHADISNTKNTFGRRFRLFVEGNPDLKVKLRDLLFVCISFEEKTDAKFKEDEELNNLLEQVLMGIICPPFSMK